MAIINKYKEVVIQMVIRNIIRTVIQIISLEPLENQLCPICGSQLVYFSTRDRTVVNPDGSKTILLIRRLKCENTGCSQRIHHELPAGYIVPYKRHCAETIEEVINGGTTKAVENEQRTVDRIKAWWNYVLPYFLNVLKSLAEKTGQVFGNPPKTVEIVRAVANSHNWIFTRSAVLPVCK